MDIQDILRGLPFPMRGALMSIMGGQSAPEYYTPSANVNQIPTGASRGPAVSRPPMITQMPEGAPRISNNEDPMASPIASALAPLPVTEVPNLPPVAAAMSQGPSAESMAPDNRDVGGGQNFAMQGPAAQDPGILARMGFSDGNQAMGALGAALAAAGSSDPAKTALGIAQQRSEEAKIAEARRRANMPKVDQVPGTPYFQITKPDGSIELSNNPALAAYYRSQSESKANAQIEKAVLDDRLARGRDASKADIKASEEARPILNDIQGLKDRWTQAKDIVANQGTGAQLQGIPGISGIAGFFGGDEVAKNKFLEGLTVDETLLNTARTKGAISNQEMNLFKSPIPSVTDDREKVWKPWIEKRLEVLDKMEKFQAAEVARSPSSAAAPNANAIQTQAAASFGAYEPNKYEYRVGPNGNLQRRLKGQ